MTKDELLRIIDFNTVGSDNYGAIVTAVEAYSSGRNDGNKVLASGLHSVNDLLPEIGETVLSYSPDEGIKQTKYTTYQKGSIGYTEGRKDCWFEWITHNNYSWKHKATHWMKMPVLPALQLTQ